MSLSADQARRLSGVSDGQVFLNIIESCVHDASRRGRRRVFVSYCCRLTDDDLDEVVRELRRAGYITGGSEDGLWIEW